MSREIKFRAWDKKRKIMYTVDNIDFCKGLINVFEPEDIASYCSGNIERPLKEVLLMQYTSLKDEKGVEGYHQDITEDSNGDRYEVAWDEDDATYYLRAIGLNVCDKELRAIKEQRIIGNIHQHPELLKK